MEGESCDLVIAKDESRKKRRGSFDGIGSWNSVLSQRFGSPREYPFHLYLSQLKVPSADLGLFVPW